MAAKSITNDRRRCSASAYNSEFEETSRGRQYSNLNCKRHYEYQKPRYQLEERPIVSTPVSIEFQYYDQAEVISQTSCVYPQVGGHLAKV